jgi:16S rRNA (guanine966-N2)-methyltransferase
MHGMRVISGKFGSRPLHKFKGMAIRPTSDRLRETLFNVLGPLVVDSLFVDCFAGSGAVGIEALSRGARQVILIENDRKATDLIRKNLESLNAGNNVELLSRDVITGLNELSKRRLLIDLLFFDPPYREIALYSRLLEFLDDYNLLAPEGRIILEHPKKIELPSHLVNLEKSRMLEQGDTAVTFYRLAKAA